MSTEPSLDEQIAQVQEDLRCVTDEQATARPGCNLIARNYRAILASLNRLRALPREQAAADTAAVLAGLEMLRDKPMAVSSYTISAIAERAIAALGQSREPASNEFTKGGGLSCEGATRADDRGDRATEETGNDRPAAPICKWCDGRGTVSGGSPLHHMGTYSEPCPQCSPAPVAQAAGEHISPALATKLLRMRDEFYANDHAEAFHILYGIADPTYTKHIGDVWADLEAIATAGG